MFKSRSTYPIGIDIGTQKIYAVQFKKNDHDLVVRGWAHRELDGEIEDSSEKRDTRVSLLKDMVHHAPFVGKRAVLHIPPKDIISFPIRFQVGKEESLEEAILRESKGSLSFPVEEAILDYPSIEPLSSDNTGKYMATVIAVQRDQIDKYLLMLKQAGLTVEAVDFKVSSLIRLHQYLFDVIRDPVLLCYTGKTESLLSIVTKDSVIAHRYFPWGTQTLLEKLVANLGLSNDRDKGKILLKKYGLLHEDRKDANEVADITEDTNAANMLRAIYQIITPYIDELTYEFQKTIGYFRSEAQNVVLNSIYIYGQAALIHHLDRYLEKRIDIPVNQINPMAKVILSDESILSDITEGTGFDLALGLAMRKVTWL